MDTAQHHTRHPSSIRIRALAGFGLVLGGSGEREPLSEPPSHKLNKPKALMPPLSLARTTPLSEQYEVLFQHPFRYCGICGSISGCP
jgi:hypothetical protein